jgi:hypothetical protein
MPGVVGSDCSSHSAVAGSLQKICPAQGLDRAECGPKVPRPGSEGPALRYLEHEAHSRPGDQGFS